MRAVQSPAVEDVRRVVSRLLLPLKHGRNDALGSIRVVAGVAVAVAEERVVVVMLVAFVVIVDGVVREARVFAPAKVSEMLVRDAAELVRTRKFVFN